MTCLQNIVLDDAVPLSVCEDVWAKLFLRIPIRCFRHYFKKSVQENSTKMMIERHAPQNRQKSTKSMSVFISRKAHGSFRDSELNVSPFSRRLDASILTLFFLLFPSSPPRLLCHCYLSSYLV